LGRPKGAGSPQSDRQPSHPKLELTAGVIPLASQLVKAANTNPSVVLASEQIADWDDLQVKPSNVPVPAPSQAEPLFSSSSAAPAAARENS